MAYLHHTLIHFPIAFTLLAALLVVVTLLRPKAVAPAAARLVAHLAALAAVAALITGLLSAAHAIDGGLDAAKVALHRNLAIAATIITVAAALLAWRGARSDTGPLPKIGAAVGMIAALAVTLAAHFGGDMVHPGLAPWSTGGHSHGAMMGSVDSGGQRDAGAPDAVDAAIHARDAESGVDAAPTKLPTPPLPDHHGDHAH